MKTNIDDRKEYRKQYYLKNKEKHNQQCKDNYIKNKERYSALHKAYAATHKEDTRNRVKKWRNTPQGQAWAKAYYAENKQKILKWRREYKALQRRTNPLFKAQEAARSMLKGAISRMGYTKKARCTKILGCSFLEFKTYMEQKFTEGMTWLNHGDWHIDHIIPLSSATNEVEVLKLNHYTNLQPLWALDNLRKGSAFDNPVTI